MDASKSILLIFFDSWRPLFLAYLKAEHRNHVWSYDFVMDQTEDGRRLKMLPVVDEYTRECLTVDVERHFTAGDVLRTLERLFEERGAPAFIRSDNGPEFIATAVKEWLKEKKVSTLYIEPGSPWENAYAESFNARFRDELLDRELFVSLLEAQVLVAEYVKEYNQDRPPERARIPVASGIRARGRERVCRCWRKSTTDSHSTWHIKRGHVMAAPKIASL
jgi:transposase InsO family protein